jgi:hypothetical protein
LFSYPFKAIGCKFFITGATELEAGHCFHDGSLI